MLLIGRYTNTDRVRGALGFTISDVPDLYIKDREVEEELLISLYEWLPNHESLFTSWTGAGATEDEKQYARLLRKYSTYMCAFHLCSGLELLALKEIGDSKATAGRFSNLKSDTFRKRIEGIALAARADIVEALDLATSATTATILASVPPAIDPVVGS